MLIVIPTYKRLVSVRLVVRSLLNCELPPQSEKLRVAIVNNYPPNRAAIEKDIAEVWSENPNSDFWELIFIHREKTIPQIDNWYSAIHQLAVEDEIFILQGDDDLFTPWSLTERYFAFKEAKADFLLSHAYSGLTYLENEEDIHYDGSLPSVRDGAKSYKRLDFENFEIYSPVFIGSQAFVYNKQFKNALDTVEKWTKGQENWLDYHYRTVMYPYYLAVAYLFIKSKVIGLDSYCCIRGTSLNEKMTSPYNSSRGWNSGFLAMVVLDIFNNEDLRDLKGLQTSRNIHANEAANWYLTNYIDKRVDKKRFALARKLVPFNMRFSNIVFGIKVILQQHLGLKHISLRNKVRAQRGVYKADHFIKQLTTIL